MSRKPLLCRFGVHFWRYWRQATRYYMAFPDDPVVSRTCVRCGTMQCTDERGVRWFPRA